MTEEESYFTEEFEDCFRAVNRFLDLRDATIEFPCVCMVDDDLDYAWTEAVEETTFYRYEIVRVLFETLNDREHSASGLQSLTFKHLQL